MMLYDANKKSDIVGYLFWFFLGVVGAHRFYHRKIITGIAMLFLFILGFLLIPLGGIGAFLLFIVLIWWIVDAFLVVRWTRKHNSLLAQQLTGSGAFPSKTETL